MNKTLILHVKKLIIIAKKEKEGIFTIDENIENFSIFNVKIRGPDNTPYQGALFTINISISNPLSYPKEIPFVKFITKIKHPNINLDTGYICLDILRNQWMGHSMELLNIIQHIHSLLRSPNPDDPFNIDIVRTYKNSYKEYLEEIVDHTKKYGEKDKFNNYLSQEKINDLSK